MVMMNDDHDDKDDNDNGYDDYELLWMTIFNSADGLVLDDDGDNVDDKTQHNNSQAKPESPKYVETQENKYQNIKHHKTVYSTSYGTVVNSDCSCCLLPLRLWAPVGPESSAASARPTGKRSSTCDCAKSQALHGGIWRFGCSRIPLERLNLNLGSNAYRKWNSGHQFATKQFEESHFTP